MPSEFRSTPVAMRYAVGDQRGMFGWALPASLVVHLGIVALLILGLPVPLSQPEKEDAIKVDLVSPPEKAKAEPPQPPKAPHESKAENPVKPPPELPPALKDVVQYGEKDAGPRISRDGDSTAEQGSVSQPAQHSPDGRDPTAQTPPPPEAAQAPDAAMARVAPDMPAP
jgi:hypothetical protein